jgi:ADP-L-glycero-D-manno-heptose 6-epimerase
MYGFSKHLFDLWVKREKLLDKVVGLKYFNVFGPNEYHKGRMASMAFHMFYQAKEKGFIGLFKSNHPKYGDGDQCRDFIYVKDAVRMTCNLLEDSFRDVSGIFNIGTGESVTWNKMATALFDAMGQKPNIQYIEMPVDLLRQYQNYTCAEMKKYIRHHQDEFRYTPVEEAMKDYVQNYLLQHNRTW